MAGSLPISISLHPRPEGEGEDGEDVFEMQKGLESYVADLEKRLLAGADIDDISIGAPAGGSSSSSADPPPPPPPPPASSEISVDVAPPPPPASSEMSVDVAPPPPPPPAVAELSTDAAASGENTAGPAQASTADNLAMEVDNEPAPLTMQVASPAPAQHTGHQSQASSAPAVDAIVPVDATVVATPSAAVEEEEAELGPKSWEDVSAAAAGVWDMIMADEEAEAEKIANPVDAMFPDGLPGVSEVEKQVQQSMPMFPQGYPPVKQAIAEPEDPVDLMFPNGLPKASDLEDDPDPVDLMFPNGLPKASEVEEDPVDVMFPNGLPTASQVVDLPEVSLPATFTAQQKSAPSGPLPGLVDPSSAGTGTSVTPSAGSPLPGVLPNLPKAADASLVTPPFTAPGVLSSPDALPLTAPGLASLTAPGLPALPALANMPLPTLPALPGLPTAGAPALASSSSTISTLSLNPGVAPPPPAAGLAAPESLELAASSSAAEGASNPAVLAAQEALYSAAMEAQQAQYLQQMQFFQQLRNQPSNAPMKRQGGRFTDDFQPFRLCKRFMNGDCWQGSSCTYAHDFAELHPASPDLPQQEEVITSALAEQAPSKPEEDTMPDMRLRKKLDICLKYKNSGSCERGNRCPYAHGEDELGTVAFVVCEKVKLRICKHWSQGACMYGKTCIYAHGAEEIGTKQPPFMGPPIKKRKEGESLDDWRKSVLRTEEEAKAKK